MQHQDGRAKTGCDGVNELDSREIWEYQDEGQYPREHYSGDTARNVASFCGPSVAVVPGDVGIDAVGEIVVERHGLIRAIAQRVLSLIGDHELESEPGDREGLVDNRVACSDEAGVVMRNQSAGAQTLEELVANRQRPCGGQSVGP